MDRIRGIQVGGPLRRFLGFLALIGWFALHRKTPGGGDGPGKPPGDDGPGRSPDGPTPPPQGVTSALSSTGDTARRGRPAGDIGDDPPPGADGAGRTGTEWDNVDGGNTPDPDTIYTSPEREDHILDGDPNDPESGGHRYGTGRPNKTEFPERWRDADSEMEHIEDVARNPDRPPRELPDGNWEVFGNRDGVNLRVIVSPNGSILTAHPISGDGVVKNDRNGNPHPKLF